MPQSPFEIIAGPATVYVAPVGEAFPLVNANPVGNWFSLGDTDGGVTVNRRQSVNPLRTDQTVAPVKAIRPEIDLEITFSIAELPLENLAKVLNDVTVTSAGGPPSNRSIPLAADHEVKQLAMLIRFPSPYGNFNAQYEIPRVVMSGEPEMTYTREDKTVCTTTWMGIADPNASDPSLVFGRMRAQDA